jgi:Uma2 family endonuclease
MSAVLQGPPPRTVEAFLAWERQQSLRFEWDGVQPVAMTGGTYAHGEIATRLGERLREALRGGPCRVIRGDMQVRVGDRVRYPDLVVTCAPVAPRDLVVPEPVVVVEVLSETSAAVDRGVKREEYASIPSLARCVMLAQDEALALVCERGRGFEETQERQVLELPEIGARIPLAPLYEGLLGSGLA